MIYICYFSRCLAYTYFQRFGYFGILACGDEIFSEIQALVCHICVGPKNYIAVGEKLGLLGRKGNYNCSACIHYGQRPCRTGHRLFFCVCYSMSYCKLRLRFVHFYKNRKLKTCFVLLLRNEFRSAGTRCVNDLFVIGIVGIGE